VSKVQMPNFAAGIMYRRLAGSAPLAHSLCQKGLESSVKWEIWLCTGSVLDEGSHPRAAAFPPRRG
jgi:hypothetical protein